MIRAFIGRIRSSFFLPMCVLPRAQRRALYDLYDFCRTVDDITDGEGTAEHKLSQLAEWEKEIDHISQGSRPRTALGRRLKKRTRTYILAPEHFHRIIEGMRMDVNGQMIAPPLQTLEHYSYCVAGCVGLLAIRIFGCTRSESDAFARQLGHALQFTNMLRDLKDDAAMGRIYLPREWLEQVGIADMDPQDIPHRLNSVRPVLHRMAEKAAFHFQQAEQWIHPQDRKALRCALLMAHIYRRLLDRMQADGYSYRMHYRATVGDIGRVLCQIVFPKRNNGQTRSSLRA